MIKTISVRTRGTGLYEITERIAEVVREFKVKEGLCVALIQHTSASLIIQENADPSAKEDLESWLNRLVPEHEPWYTHTLEGNDDMPAHIKAALTATSLAIPIENSQLALGAWQGVYIWEHRERSHSRSVIIYVTE